MSTLKVNDIVEATSGGGKIWPNRAWANLNENGTMALRNDGNVSSLTDNAGGDFTLTYSNSLAYSNYAVAGSVNQINTSDHSTLSIASSSNNTNVATYTTSATRLRTGMRGLGYYQDMAYVTVQVTL